MHREILVIDDNPDIRSLLSSILKEQNFILRTAANYDQAVFEIEKKLPDLAIIDIKLDKTDKDGIDLLKLITRKNKLTPIIMISGHATVQIAVEVVGAGKHESHVFETGCIPLAQILIERTVAEHVLSIYNIGHIPS